MKFKCGASSGNRGKGQKINVRNILVCLQCREIIFFYIYMLVAFMLVLLLQMYICDILGQNDEVSSYLLRKTVSCRCLFRFLDLLLTVILARAIEGTARSASMPWLFPGEHRRCCKIFATANDASATLIGNSEATKIENIRTEFSSVDIQTPGLRSVSVNSSSGLRIVAEPNAHHTSKIGKNNSNVDIRSAKK